MPGPPPQVRKLRDHSPARHVSQASIMEGKHSQFERQKGGAQVSPFDARSSKNDPSSVHVGPRSSTSIAVYDAKGNEGPPQWYRVSYSAEGDGLTASSQPLTTRNLTEHNETSSLASPQSTIEQALHRRQAQEAALLQIEIHISQDVLVGSARDYAGMEPLARFLVEEGHWCPARRTPRSARGLDN